jgi:anti-sigma regulatory factor (Ser/Thr protein kinase)
MLHIARSYVHELTTLAELPPEEAQDLVLAADEACTNVIEHAFDPGESGTFTVVGELTPAALTLAVHDRGLPFDPSVAPAYTPPTGEDVSSVSARGLGLYLIHQTVDEVHWINHGREGKELRLVKYRPQADVTAHLPEAELAPFRDDEPLAPPQEYTIRRLRPEEAVWVARCIYRAYGHTYFNEDLYYPERIARQNETGELISAVAVSQGGEVERLVGHCAAERPDLGPVAELGQGVVEPAHRKRGLLGRMIRFLEEESRKLGLLGFWAEPVTSHVFSQRALEDFDFGICGATLGLMPRSVRFRKIRTEPLPQRESCLLYFRHLVSPPTAAVYAPAHHRAMLERIYAELEMLVEFLEPEPADGPGRVMVHFHRGLGVGSIRVQRVGADVPTEIHQMRRDLCEIAGAQMVYLELPLAQAGTPDVCRAAEEEGFFFSGLGPRFAPDGDVLRLQYLNAPLDPTQIQVVSPFGQELLAYTSQEWDRVTQLRIGG